MRLGWVLPPCRENMLLPFGRLFLHIFRQIICKHCVAYPFFKEQMLKDVLILSRGYVYWFSRERKGKKERETGNTDVREKDWLVASHPHHDWDTLGVCLDRESNLHPFGVWDHAPTSWTTQSGQRVHFRNGKGDFSWFSSTDCQIFIYSLNTHIDLSL